MFNRESRQMKRIDTLIGKSARIQGDLEFAGGLHLDGHVLGNVRGDPTADSALSVSEQGYIEGFVEAANVVLNGAVKGDIHARERIVLGPRARVQGNVAYGIIEMAMGAEITGRLMPLSSETVDEAAEPEARTA
jgi:cytoskeletal protein CcmA (bactofilin family)